MPVPTEIATPDDSAEALAAVVALRRLADRLERAAVAHAVDEGWTWAQVAEALGVTRQAVHKKHARRRA
jgi:DNA-directed RNA polymerase specialized sigma24 family protein